MWGYEEAYGNYCWCGSSCPCGLESSRDGKQGATIGCQNQKSGRQAGWGVGESEKIGPCWAYLGLLVMCMTIKTSDSNGFFSLLAFWSMSHWVILLASSHVNLQHSILDRSSGIRLATHHSAQMTRMTVWVMWNILMNCLTREGIMILSTYRNNMEYNCGRVLPVWRSYGICIRPLTRDVWVGLLSVLKDRRNTKIKKEGKK